MFFTQPYPAASTGVAGGHDINRFSIDSDSIYTETHCALGNMWLMAPCTHTPNALEHLCPPSEYWNVSRLLASGRPGSPEAKSQVWPPRAEEFYR